MLLQKKTACICETLIMYKTNFKNGNIYRNILELALPMTVGQFLNLLYNIVDRIYIGRIEGVGDIAFAGVGICFPIITLITAFTFLFGNGGAPLCSMAQGKGDKNEAEYIMGNTFSMLLITGVLLTVLGYIFHRPLLYLLGASDVTYQYASKYLLIYLVGTLSVMITLGLNPFINAQGFGNMGMITILISAVLNILLDPLFIFALNMGVSGAAFATVISQTVSALWVVKFLTGKKAVLKLRLSAMKIQFSRVKKIMSLGVSGFVMAFSNSLVQMVCNAVLKGYGDIYISIMTVINSVREIVTMPIMGLTHGASPVMSYNYGAGEYKRVKDSIKFITLLCVVYTCFMWAVVSVFPEFFIRIFNDNDQLVKMCSSAMHIYFFGFCFMSFQFTGQSVFVALGKSAKATFFSIFRKVFIVVPLTLLLPHLFSLGVNGVFWAEPLSNFIGGVACFVTMYLTVMSELNKKSTILK